MSRARALWPRAMLVLQALPASFLRLLVQASPMLLPLLPAPMLTLSRSSSLVAVLPHRLEDTHAASYTKSKTSSLSCMLWQVGHARLSALRRFPLLCKMHSGHCSPDAHVARTYKYHQIC